MKIVIFDYDSRMDKDQKLLYQADIVLENGRVIKNKSIELIDDIVAAGRLIK